LNKSKIYKQKASSYIIGLLTSLYLKLFFPLFLEEKAYTKVEIASLPLLAKKELP